MRKSKKLLLPILLFSLIVAVPSLWANWIEDGIRLCTETGDQSSPQLTSDGAGGAIITWEDFRSGARDIYAQRTDISGAVQWTTDGVPLCVATGEQYYPRIVSDGTGGAIIAWEDVRGGQKDIYAQRIDASGTVQWTTDGVPICTAAGNQYELLIASDGAGGMLLTWMDSRNITSNDIYAQKINGSGIVQWTTDGVLLCSAAGSRNDPQVTTDGAGGAIVTWWEYRISDHDIYVQRIDAAGTVQWTTDGVAICTATEDQWYPQIIFDGAGGAIITWADYRRTVYDIYAQRIDASGTPQWTADGIPLCEALYDQWSPQIISDGAGGAIVTWFDYRYFGTLGTTNEIYAQRVDASGTVLWATDGVPLCIAAEDQKDPRIASDGASGAIVTWHDYRSTEWDIYAQRIDASGTVRWTTDGVHLCTALNSQEYPEITSNGASGAIVAWRDDRSGTYDYDIYAQQIDSLGRVGYLPQVITSVSDLPGDEGGWVRINIHRSTWDHEEWYSHPISLYNIWQRIDNPALLAAIEQKTDDGVPGELLTGSPPNLPSEISNTSGWPIIEYDDRCFVQSGDLLQAGEFPSGTWELLGSFAACQQEEYIYRASTLADSTESGIPYSVYVVSAHTTTPSIWYLSVPDSGYSVDNLPPALPEGLIAEQSFTPEGLLLDWEVNVENDFSYYAIYRGESEIFEPVPGNRIAVLVDPGYFDDEWTWDSGYYYKLSAVDIHGNESGFALLSPDAVTGAETPDAPAAAYLSQNYPNPFNPVTTIEFGLSETGLVTLRVYDPAGRLVATIIDETMPAGHYSESWNGLASDGRAVSSGVYFYKLETELITETRKMILLR